MTSSEPKPPSNSKGFTYSCMTTSSTQPHEQGQAGCTQTDTQHLFGRANELPSHELQQAAGKQPRSRGPLLSTVQCLHQHPTRPHAWRGMIFPLPSGIVMKPTHEAASTFLLHTYPSSHPLLPPLALASLITRPLAFSLTHSLTHPFTCFSFISPFSYTIPSSNTFKPLGNSTFASCNIPVLTSLINIPTLRRAS